MLKDFRVLLILCLTVASLSLPASANEVVQWNETTLKAIEANGQGNVVATRTLAMVQVAVHDALNAVSRRYDAYYFEGPGDPAPPNPPIANADLARGYVPSAIPGWANVTPFTLLSASQFWLPGPPALTSATYARDYNEVKSIGGKVSTVRTDEQTQIARFWFEGPGAWNTITRTIATTRRLDARDGARDLALMNIAIADPYIAGWKIRYVYDAWRPVTATREGDNDGNDATVGDPIWDSHQNTPAVSDYPSTQSTFSAAAAVALATALGGDQVSFTVTSGKPFEG